MKLCHEIEFQSVCASSFRGLGPVKSPFLVNIRQMFVALLFALEPRHNPKVARFFSGSFVFLL